MDVESTLALRTNAELIETIDGLKEEFASFMPRRIMPPNGYMHPRLWWTTSFSIIHPDLEQMGYNPPRDLRVCVANAAGILRRLNAPTYFPSRELIDALDKTDVSNIDFADVRFPADSIMFVLPTEPPYMPYGMEFMGKNITVAPVAVTLSRFDSFLRTEDGSQTTLRDRPVLEGTMLDTKGDMGWVRIPCEGPWSDTMDKYGSKIVYDRNGVPVDPTDNPTVRSDSEQTQWAFRMGIKLLIAMNTVGDIHAPAPRLVRAANPKRGKGELWQGQVMTLSRAIAPEDATGTHASPRFHLRRGHMRQQRHGERNSLVKTVWIKPTWVGTAGGRQPGGEHSHERTES
jgi:hypothetical protein